MPSSSAAQPPALTSIDNALRTDRERQNALLLAGWTVLGFSWRDLCEHPQRFIAQLTSAVAAANRSKQGANR